MVGRPLLLRAGLAGVTLTALWAGPLGAAPALAEEGQGTVSGTVTDAATGSPLPDVCVDLLVPGSLSTSAGSGCTDTDGVFTTTPAPPGDYVVRFVDQSGEGYLTEYHAGQSDPASATTVAVTSDADTGGVDASLRLGGRITGTISAPDGQPAPDQCVYAWPVGASDWLRSACTDDAGRYTVTKLPTGAYELRVDGGSDYLPAWYADASAREDATAVTVAAGQTRSAIDQTMTDAGRISGTVTDAATGDPLVWEDFCVHVSRDGTEVRTVCPFATADWQVVGLPPGIYTVKFTADGYADQWWDSRNRASLATPVVLGAAEDRTGVDAAMTEPVDTLPDSPTGAKATAGNAAATVSWTPPEYDGGSPVTGYTVTSNPGSKTAKVTGTGTTATVTGLTNGTAYTFTVTATNAVGTSPASAASNSVTPKAPATAPGAPTGVKATAGDARASVSWTAPTSNGGSAITTYTVTSNPGGRTATTSGATSATVTGLTNGTAYTFTVTATNAVGTSVASAKSAAVTPTAPAPPVASGVVERWGGADRFASSAAFSAKSYATGVNVAYIANGTNFPDALSGAPIAGKTGGPVLLTNTNSLPGAIATELKRLKPKKIVVLGGTGAVSTAVERQLKGYLG